MNYVSSGISLNFRQDDISTEIVYINNTWNHISIFWPPVTLISIIIAQHRLCYFPIVAAYVSDGSFTAVGHDAPY